MKKEYDMEMEKLEDFLTSKKYFIIPRYQRKYIWQKENIKQLIEDINLYNELNSRFFIGNIVILKRKNNEYEIIDGQQRITTLQLIILSIIYSYKKVNSKNLNDKIDYLKDFVYVLLSNGKKINKLKTDDKSYDILLNYCISKDRTYIEIDEYLEKEDSVFIEKFKNIIEFFEELQISSENEIDNFRDKLINININAITAYMEQDAYTIFETLNARGVQLTQTELLKNYIFKYIAEGDTIDITNEEWKKMYDKNDEDMDNFTFHFFRMYYGYKEKLEDLYKYVKNECNKKKNTKEEVKKIFSEMKKTSEYYKRLQNLQIDNSYESKTYNYMKAKSNKQLRALLIALYYKKQEKLIDDYHYNDFMKMIFKFFVGFNILKNTSNKINSLVITTSNKIYNSNSSFCILKEFYHFYNNLEEYFPGKDDFENRIAMLKFSNKNKKGNVNSKTLVFLLNEIMESDEYDYTTYNIEHIYSDDATNKIRWELGNLIAIPVKFHKEIKTDNVEEKLKLYSKSGIKHLITFTSEYKEFKEEDIHQRTKNINKKILDVFFINKKNIEKKLNNINSLDSYFKRKKSEESLEEYDIRKINHMLELIEKENNCKKLDEFISNLNSK